MGRVRLHKFLANAGISSRRRAEELIAAGRVRVNGEVVTRLGTVIDDSLDEVEVDGVRVRPLGEKCAVLVYKPTGYVSSTRDPWGRPVVIELVGELRSRRLYPVGRLDLNSEGLMVLTDDGELAHLLTHPSHGVEKEYLVEIDGVPRWEELELLRRGVRIGEVTTSPAKVELEDVRDRKARVRVTIREGKKRQVRRMFETIGYEVVRLIRTRIGTLRLNGLRPGEYRFLTESEIVRLKRAVGSPGERKKEEFGEVGKKGRSGERG